MSAPQGYTYWRMGQGFSKEQTEFLYMTVDNTSDQISDMKCWLKSHDANQQTDVSHSVQLLYEVQSSLLKQKTELSMELLERLNLMFPTLSSSAKLALTGKYLESFILLRSAFEGMFRFYLDLVYKIERKNLGTWSLKSEDWESVRASGLLESTTSASALSNIIRRLKLDTPFTRKTDIVKYSKIRSLNKYTHAVIEHIISNRAVSFSQEKKDMFVEGYTRMTEITIILYQNLINKIEPKIGLIVDIDNVDETDMPKLYELLKK